MDNKRAFKTKKEALSRLNTLSDKMKKPPTRCYFDEGMWYLTSKQKTVTTLMDTIDCAIKDSYAKKRHNFESKEQMEEEIRFRNFLTKQIELYANKNRFRKD